MNVLILNGGLAADHELDAIHATLEGELTAHGHTVKACVLRDLPIAYCLGCFDCYVKTPGVCRTNDSGRDVTNAFIISDVVMFLTPVTFGGYSSELKKALDRCIGLVSPFFTRMGGEVHHHARYARYPAIAAVGVMSEPSADEEYTFRSLVRRNATNMHAPWHACRVLYRGQSSGHARSVPRPFR